MRRRRFWAAVALVAGYQVFLWVLGGLIDARALRNELEEQASLVLATDVVIGEVEPEVRFFGGWRIRLRDIRADNPSPDFRGKLFTVRKVVFEGALIDLLRGVWRPRILVKGWTLDISRLPDGYGNLEDVLRPQGLEPKAWGQWPMSEIAAATQTFELEEGQIRYLEGETGDVRHATGLLSGTGTYRPADAAEGLSGAVEAEISGVPDASRGLVAADADRPGRITARFDVLGFSVESMAIHGTWDLEIEGERLPLAVGLDLLRLPPPPPGSGPVDGRIRLAGRFDERDRPILRGFDLTLSGSGAPLVGVSPPLRLTAERAAEAPAPEGAAEAATWSGSASGADAADERATRRAAWRARRTDDGLVVSVEADRFDLHELPLAAEAITGEGDAAGGDADGGAPDDAGEGWEDLLLSPLRRFEAEAGEWRMLGFRVEEARIWAELAPPAIRRFALRGAFYDGRIDFGAGGWRLGDPGWPDAVGVTVRNADATQLLPAVAHLLPTAWQTTPSEGRITCLLFHVPKATDPAVVFEESLLDRLRMDVIEPEAVGAREGWTGTVLVSDPVRFDEPGGNPVLEALWAAPAHLKSAARRCGDAELVGPDAPDALPALRVRTGLLTAGRDDRTKRARLEGEFLTEELGRVVLEAEPPEGEAPPTLVVRFFPCKTDREAPAPMLRDAPEAFRRLVGLVEANGGLRIRFVGGAEELRVEHAYEEALVRTWRTVQASTEEEREGDTP